jgi:hypothetical protein
LWLSGYKIGIYDKIETGSKPGPEEVLSDGRRVPERTQPTPPGRQNGCHRSKTIVFSHRQRAGASKPRAAVCRAIEFELFTFQRAREPRMETPANFAEKRALSSMLPTPLAVLRAKCSRRAPTPFSTSPRGKISSKFFLEQLRSRDQIRATTLWITLGGAHAQNLRVDGSCD